MVVEYITVALANRFTQVLSQFIPKTLGNDLARETLKLAEESCDAYIVRADNHHTGIINIYSCKGVKLFTIEQGPNWSSNWYLYSYPARAQLAVITNGLLGCRVALANGSSITTSLGGGILGKLHRHFYDREGNHYSWNRRSQSLERIVNEGGGHEERRQEIARFHQLRNSRFEWEFVVDPQQLSLVMDLVMVLSTGFIALKTQTPLARRGIIPGFRLVNPTNARGSVPKAAAQPQVVKTPVEADFTGNDISRLLVYEPEPVSKEPLDFFNPPAFLEAKIFKKQMS